MTVLTCTQVALESDEDRASRVAQVLDGKPYVYACLDANRIGNLPEQLEVAEVPHLCLFQGDLAEEAGDLAPWLVKLAADDPFLGQLLTSAGEDQSNPFGYWEAQAGIFLHSDMSLQDLQRHLRRFLRVHAPDDRKFLFRFWEPAIAAAYFTGLDGREALISRWFLSREGGQITWLVVPDGAAADPSLTVITASGVDADAPPPRGVFALEEQDFARFGTVRMEQDVSQIAARLAKTFPDAAAKVPGGLELDDFVRASMSRMMQFGLTKKATLFTLLAWDLHYGPQFETRDPEDELLRLISAELNQNEKFDLLKKRMSALGQ